MDDRNRDWVSLTAAAERLGLHRNTMRKRVQQWELTQKRNPLNLREVAVDWNEILEKVQGFYPEEKTAA